MPGRTKNILNSAPCNMMEIASGKLLIQGRRYSFPLWMSPDVRLHIVRHFLIRLTATFKQCEKIILPPIAGLCSFHFCPTVAGHSKLPEKEQFLTPFRLSPLSCLLLRPQASLLRKSKAKVQFRFQQKIVLSPSHTLSFLPLFLI